MLLAPLSVAFVAFVAFASANTLEDPVPAPPVDPETQERLNQHQLELHEYSRIHGRQRTTFRSKWISQSGVHDNKPSDRYTVQVKATNTVSDLGLKLASDTVFNLVKQMNPSIFQKMSTMGCAVGVFSYMDEGGLTVYPEFSQYKDRPECKGNCSGSCANTCTGDGRKYETLAGLASTQLAATLEDVILCNSRDPYYGKLNVVTHEFAHSIHMGTSGMTSPYRPTTFGRQIRDSYSYANYYKIWEMDSYAMTNEYEYFAEGTGVYFNVDQYFSAGGMNKCDGYSSSSCSTEAQARKRISSKDSQLYNALTEIYVSQDPNKVSGLKTCMK